VYSYCNGINLKPYNCPVLILNTPCSSGGRGNCNFSNLMSINKDYAEDIIKNSLLHSKLSLCPFKLEEIPSCPVYRLIKI
jgi:hypothetical protein